MKEKKITFKRHTDEVVKATAVYEKGMGITIIADRDPDEYLLCVTCSNSPKWLDCWDAEEQDRVFDLVIGYIEQGHVDHDCFHSITECQSGGASQATCPLYG